jgi:peptide/nickel transport system permease protein
MKFLAKRTAAAVPTLLLVLFLSFLLIDLVPGDPARIVAGSDATPAQLDVVRARLGLDKPFVERMGTYVVKVAQGDLGKSLQNQQPVTERIASSLPVTMSLGLVAMLFALIIAVPCGVLAALNRGRWFDHVVALLSSLLIAIPPFVVGLIFVVVFALQRSWLPAAGYVPFGQNPLEWLRSLILPGLALALTPAAELVRQIRGTLVDTMEQDFVRTVRAKGMPRRYVLGKHAAKNAAPPVVTVLGLQVGRILGGAVVVERIFAISGFGTLAFDAVLSRDLPLIQGVVLVSALAVIICNVLVDFSYGYFNPRLRSTG